MLYYPAPSVEYPRAALIYTGYKFHNKTDDGIRKFLFSDENDVNPMSYR